MQKKQGIILAIILTLVINLLMPITVSSATIRPYGLKVSAGLAHTLIIDDQGNVWAFGDNSSGQIGDGSTVSRERPAQVYNHQWEGRAISVAAGSKQSLVLLEDGTVLQWGYNNFSLPIQKRVTLDGKVLDIAAAQDLCMAIIQRSNGAIEAVAWSNLITETTIKTQEGSTFKGVRQISAGSNNFSVLLDDSGNVYEIDTQFRAIPVKIMPNSELSSGLARFLTLFQDDEPEATATPEATLTPIATLTVEPTPIPTATPTPIPTATPEPTPTPTPQPLTGVVEISAGADFGVALTASGDVYTWGNPRNGVLGYPATNYSAQAKKVTLPSAVRRISAGSEHVIAILENNNVYAWGKRDASGMSGTGSTDTPTRITTGAGPIAQISSSTYHNVVLNGSSQYFIWGNFPTSGQVVLQEYLVLSEDPSISASTIGDTYMTVSWNIDDFYTEMMLGFEVEYILPGGVGSKSQLLPVNHSQITFRSLQPETNHTIKVTAYGKTGFSQSIPEIVVTTLELDEEEITPTPSPTSESTATPIPTATPVPTQVNGTDDEDENGISIFGIILIVLALLILVAAIFAIIFVWKKIDNDDSPKIKPVRIATDKDNNSVNVLWNDVAKEDQNKGNEDLDEDMKVLNPNEPGDNTPENADDLPEDEFLTRRPKTHEFEDDVELNGDKKE